MNYYSCMSVAGYLRVALCMSIEEVLHHQHIQSLGVACLCVLEPNAVGTNNLGQGQGSLYTCTWVDKKNINHYSCFSLKKSIYEHLDVQFNVNVCTVRNEVFTIAQFI